jgi:hypothetical protein
MLATIIKEMRITSLLIISLLICSCSNQNSLHDEKIRIFEKVLGEKETLILNEMVAEFDQLLKSKYGNSNKNERFRKYLEDFMINGEAEFYFVDSIKFQKYKKSKLFSTYNFKYGDTIWIDNDEFYLKYKVNSKEKEVVPIKYKIPEDEKLLEFNKLNPKKRLIERGSFYIALDSIKNSDSLLLFYAEMKETFGDISPVILADGILYYTDQSPDYFSKRIFVMDINDK